MPLFPASNQCKHILQQLLNKFPYNCDCDEFVTAEANPPPPVPSPSSSSGQTRELVPFFNEARVAELSEPKETRNSTKPASTSTASAAKPTSTAASAVPSPTVPTPSAAGEAQGATTKLPAAAAVALVPSVPKKVVLVEEKVEVDLNIDIITSLNQLEVDASLRDDDFSTDFEVIDEI
jgi:cytoskeletal protein RodZ